MHTQEGYHGPAAQPSLIEERDLSTYVPTRAVGRLKTKLITGPAKHGLLGVLQAEHNLTIRLRSFPSAINLRWSSTPNDSSPGAWPRA